MVVFYSQVKKGDCFAPFNKFLLGPCWNTKIHARLLPVNSDVRGDRLTSWSHPFLSQSARTEETEPDEEFSIWVWLSTISIAHRSFLHSLLPHCDAFHLVWHWSDLSLSLGSCFQVPWIERLYGDCSFHSGSRGWLHLRMEEGCVPMGVASRLIEAAFTVLCRFKR